MSAAAPLHIMTPARARVLVVVPRERPETREERVRVCRDLMLRGRWKTGLTGRALARMWRMAPGTMASIAGEASRRLKDVVDPGWVRQCLGAEIHDAMEGARECEPKERADAVSTLARAWAPLAGANAPTRLEHSGPGGTALGLPPHVAALQQ